MTPSTITRSSPSLFQATPPVHCRGGSLSVTCLIVVAAVIAGCCQALPVQAQVQNWTNTSNSNAWFQVASNWSPPITPNPASHVDFGAPSAYKVWWNEATAAASPTVDSLTVAQGNVLFLNQTGSPLPALRINNGLTISSALTLRGLYLHSHAPAEITGSLTLDSMHAAGSRLTFEPFRHLTIDGSMHVSGANSSVTAWDSEIGDSGTGHVTITDGATWSNQVLSVGGRADATLDVSAGGRVFSTSAFISEYDGLNSSTVTVSGSGSQWNNSGFMDVSGVNFGSGNCSLNIAAGGLVSSRFGTIEDAYVSVTGSGSIWNLSDALVVGFGDRHNADLYIQDGGKVTVGGTTKIASEFNVWRGGRVHMSGSTSRFEFGQTSLSEFERIYATGGSLAGNLGNSGYTHVTDFTTSMSSNVNVDEVKVLNSGTLYGDGAIRFGLNNTASGEVETSAGDRMRFAGSGNTNAGEINNFGGQIRFAQGLYNSYGGMIAGRGQFIADGGWSNSGTMAFSAGLSDVLGDVYNDEGATIVTTGNATTTFHDDMYNGVAGEIRTALGSNTVFLGAVEGSGNFTGLGTVFMEGDLRPGNSPGSMSFGGDLVMGESASLLMELGGMNTGNFDQLFVAGDLFLNNNQLDVALWDGFTLATNMQFLIADVGGGLFGQFSGLGEGSLVGNFGGTDLFITYNGIGGNAGVGLFTSAVPEPSALALIGIAAVLGLAYRRRRRD